MTKKPPKQEDIGAKLAALASIIADEALAVGVHLDQRLEAFKQLTTYHVNTTKVAAKITPEDDGEGSIDSFRKRIAAATGGTGQSDPGGGTAE